MEAEARPAEQRHVAGLDPLLELVALGLRQPARRDGLVDTILERLLQRGAERARLDAQLLGSVVQHCLVLLLRRAELRRRVGAAPAGYGETCDGSRDHLGPEPAAHRMFLSLGIDTPNRITRA